MNVSKQDSPKSSETVFVKRQPHYTIFSGLSVILVLLAAVTTLPCSSSDPNLFGYRSICAFVPLSTLILLGAAGFLRILRDMNYRTRARRGPV